MLVLDEIEVAGVYLVSIKNGILYIVVSREVEIELKHVKEVVRFRKELQNGIKTLTFLDVRKATTITKEAREYTSGKAVEGLDLAMIILSESLPHKILGNFFINFNRPPAPTKMFNSESKALAWLETYR